MSVFYLVSIILGLALQNIVKKPFAQKAAGKGVYFFSLLASLAATVFFLLTAGDFAWHGGLLLYAVFFALSYAAATVFALEAVVHGSLSLTALIVSYSLMIPTFYGLFFLDDPISFGLFPGLLLLVVSLFLINPKKTDLSVSLKWIVCVVLAFVGNGMCSVLQKMQQIAFDGAYKNEFMILSLAIVSVILGFLVIVKERKDVKAVARYGWLPALICGAANGVVNLFVMILSALMPVSLMFPMISAGGIAVTYIVSRFFYKERLTKTQFIGFLIGIASVVFFNI